MRHTVWDTIEWYHFCMDAKKEFVTVHCSLTIFKYMTDTERLNMLSSIVRLNSATVHPQDTSLTIDTEIFVIVYNLTP